MTPLPPPPHWHHLHQPHSSPESVTSTTTSDDYYSQEPVVEEPTEAQLVLLCLDYLRDLRRNFSSEYLEEQICVNPKYLSVAIYALSKSFTRDSFLHGDNDAHFSQVKVTATANKQLLEEEEEDRGEVSTVDETLTSRSSTSGTGFHIPVLETINKRILHVTSRNDKEEEKEEDGSQDQEHNKMIYAYNDHHLSNGQRFYMLNGLASGPTLRGPLTLGELIASGLVGLGARSRDAAEAEMVQSPLFEQFLSAVQSKGFFKDIEKQEEKLDQDLAEQLYQERYSKVVGKFRNKLAVKAAAAASSEEPDGDVLARNAAERHYAHRQQRIQQSRPPHLQETPERSHTTSVATPTPPHEIRPHNHDNDENHPTPVVHKEQDYTTTTAANNMSVVTSLTQKLAPPVKTRTPTKKPTTTTTSPTTPTTPSHHPVDEQEAERAKAKGNAHMQQKQYSAAAEAYTLALKLSPNGPNSHVYFSNRAAAHLSQKQVQQAVLDSERSLALKPNYAKAHARLGLSHFLLGNYHQAISAYQMSLKYDPANVSSQKYLEKATKRVAASSSHNKCYGTEENDEELQHVLRDREAEKFKVKGNSYMASRNYQAALESYTKAICKSPQGPHSHVYFSNRAAALCYLERYPEAQADSLKSLELQPTYGKAHSRLGLSRFFMGDYEGAVEAYTFALQYDPDNAASQSYLVKAKERLKRQRQQQNGTTTATTTTGQVGRDYLRRSKQVQDFSLAMKQQQQQQGSTSRDSSRSGRDASRGRSRKEALRSVSSKEDSTRVSSSSKDNREKPLTCSSSSRDSSRARSFTSGLRGVSSSSSKDCTKEESSSSCHGRRRAGSSSTRDERLLHDPDIQRLAKDAMADPSMLDAMLSAQSESSTTK